MTDKEIEKDNIDFSENNPTISYHLLYALFPFMLLQLNNDVEVQKKSFFFLLDNQDATNLKQFYLFLIVTMSYQV